MPSEDFAWRLEQEQELAAQFTALASPGRRYLLELLQHSGDYAGSLTASAADRYGVSASRASQNLQQLANAGLVRVTWDGTWRYYDRVEHGAEPVAAWLRELGLAR